MYKEKIIGKLMITVSLLIVIFNGLLLSKYLANSFFLGFLPLAIAITIGVFLLRKDSTPQAGIIFLTAALINSTVQLWGGALGSAAFLYPLLFLWMKRDSIGGPVLTIATALGIVELIAPIISASGIMGGSFDLNRFLEILPKGLIAGIIPLISMSAVEYLRGERFITNDSTNQEENKSSKNESHFPDDVARSLMPILKSATGAHGVFLFIRDQRDVWTLNEFLVNSGQVSVRYTVTSQDRIIKILSESSEDVIKISAKKLSVGGSSGLPWYIQNIDSSWISLVPFRKNNVFTGFMVLDFKEKEKMEKSCSILVDSVFLISISSELARGGGDKGFLALCENMDNSTEIRGAVHKLIAGIVTNFPDITATLAIVNKKDTLAVFESRGPQGEGRAGKEFHISDGVAGLAISRMQPLRRLRMGEIRTFGILDDPGRIIGSCCAIPLENKRGVLGVLVVESTSEQHFSPEDLDMFIAYATVFNLAVSRNQLQDILLELQELDRLTGLPLLSSFHDLLADLIRGVRSRAMSVAVLAIDIYDFSAINQQFGYKAGDMVLQKTATRLQGVLGKKAIISRNGPDCFMICLADVDRVSAEAYAARIHEEFAHKPLNISGREVIVRVSIGGAVSHVDRMILKLPNIAVDAVNKMRSKPGLSVIMEVGQFFGTT